MTIVCHGELHQFIPIFALGYDLDFRFGFSLFCLGWMIRVQFSVLVRVFVGFVRFMEFGLS